jgi:serine/threonine-protein kinase
VAVKVLAVGDVDRGRRRELLERFALEARAAGRLRHPRIVTVHDFGEDPERGLTFLAMELVEGRSLFEMTSNMGKLNWQLVTTIAHQIADALEYAHKEGVVHRDIKPANILVGKDDQVKLVDFGIAKLNAPSLTQTGMILGTPGYLSPEMIQGLRVDQRSDQFSLGTVLLEVLSGKRHFAADRFEQLALQITTRPMPTFAELGIEAPPALEDIVRRLHQKDPEQRYQDEVHLLADLASVGREAGLDLRRAIPSTQ